MKYFFCLLALLLWGCNYQEKKDSSSNLDPLYSQQWYLHYDKTLYSRHFFSPDAHIHLDSMSQKYKGKGIKIAVFDDGCDIDHEDLSGAILTTYNTGNGSSDVQENGLVQMHGTAVAGIIAARENGVGIIGIAPQSKLIIIKYTLPINTAQLIEGFMFAEQNGADVINCSWGTGDVSPALKTTLQDFANNARGGKGLPIVFASGNSNTDIVSDESGINEVISVGATNVDNLRTSYSDYGDALDIMAPGGEYFGITTLDRMNTSGYYNGNYIEYNAEHLFAGTSASAPIVTGVIALMLEANPDLTRVEIESILHQSASKIGNKDGEYDINGHSIFYGYGKINASNAIKLALQTHH